MHGWDHGEKQIWCFRTDVEYLGFLIQNKWMANLYQGNESMNRTISRIQTGLIRFRGGYLLGT